MNQRPRQTIHPPKPNEPFFKTPEELVKRKLELLKLKDGETLVDLGCGDARCLVLACEMAKVYCIGYETLPEAIEQAQHNIEQSGHADRIRLIENDLQKADLSEVNAVVLYMTRNFLGIISEKLEKELPAGARIVTHDFDIPAWKEVYMEEFKLSNGQLKPIYLYEKR